MTDQRQIPSIDHLRQRPAVKALEARFGRPAVRDALRQEAERLRQALARGGTCRDIGKCIEDRALMRLDAVSAFSLRTVLNATGVVIHTNLGRAPLSAKAAARVAELAAGYCNLEYDLGAGSRGRRDVHAERIICRLTGADAACVVNNNAAAALIALAALAAGREVIVSRGELVEIGGGFRVPDVLAQSGAVLREVGTTNRTRVSDYAAAITDRTALILRVHPSNFRIEGFTERPSVRELAALGARFSVPLVDDLGSGHVAANAPALRDEPTVQLTLQDGAALVLFSGDKLLGGPQAGIMVGSRSLVETIRRHPLMRAVRVDKMTYAALEVTLQAYESDRAHEIPVAGMIAAAATAIGERAERLAARVESVDLSATVIDGLSTIGGGSAPGATLPTRLLQLRHATLSASRLETRLRSLDPPVIARIDDGHVVLDLRTVLPAQDDLLASLLESLRTTHKDTVSHEKLT
ncbi:MAG: L-seryl-tRNA(Sec) selenium transferase [Acidobacteria bacterium]|nr:L-seryl-tRNA(Sec) selenium transferase [Acidobacteriota bacterium]